jgi:hypothetical protein
VGEPVSPCPVHAARARRRKKRGRREIFFHGKFLGEVMSNE